MNKKNIHILQNCIHELKYVSESWFSYQSEINGEEWLFGGYTFSNIQHYRTCRVQTCKAAVTQLQPQAMWWICEEDSLTSAKQDVTTEDAYRTVGEPEFTSKCELD